MQSYHLISYSWARDQIYNLSNPVLNIARQNKTKLDVIFLIKELHCINLILATYFLLLTLSTTHGLSITLGA